jgi:hypothetical protein
MMKEKMPKEMEEEMVEGSETETVESDSGVDTSEEYIAEVAKGITEVMPEDFVPVKGDFSTSAPDGEQVMLVVTGIAQGGKLTGAKMAPVPASGGEESEDGEESGLDGMFAEKTPAE